MSNNNILPVFNDHFVEFISDIQQVFPENADILAAKNSLMAIRKANPKMIVKIWNDYVVGQYKNEIESGNLAFFIDKDYSQDIMDLGKSDQIAAAIDRLRNPIKQMSAEDQKKSMKYIQNLTKLSSIYYE
jgi:hypothetical protein